MYSIGREVDCNCFTEEIISFSFDYQNVDIPLRDMVIEKSGRCLLAVHPSETVRILRYLFLRHAYLHVDIDAEAIGLANVKHTL